MPGFLAHHQLLKLAQTHVHRITVLPFNHHILCHSLLLPPWIFPSIRVYSHGSVLPIKWPKYWSFNFSISPSNEYSELISLGLTGWSSYSPRDCQESSPMSQFKTISLSALSFLFGPTFTSIHDYWKSHRCDYMDLCQQRDVSDF